MDNGRAQCLAIKAWHINGADPVNFNLNLPCYDYVYYPNDNAFLKFSDR